MRALAFCAHHADCRQRGSTFSDYGIPAYFRSLMLLTVVAVMCLEGHVLAVENEKITYTMTMSVNNGQLAMHQYRVKEFALKEVRYYSADGLIGTESAERIMHKQKG